MRHGRGGESMGEANTVGTWKPSRRVKVLSRGSMSVFLSPTLTLWSVCHSDSSDSIHSADLKIHFHCNVSSKRNYIGFSKIEKVKGAVKIFLQKCLNKKITSTVRNFEKTRFNGRGVESLKWYDFWELHATNENDATRRTPTVVSDYREVFPRNGAAFGKRR